MTVGEWKFYKIIGSQGNSQEDNSDLIDSIVPADDLDLVGLYWVS